MDSNKSELKSETESQFNVHIQTVHTNPNIVKSKTVKLEPKSATNPQYVLVEDFNDLVGEVLNMKKAMKDIIGQLIDEFEDSMSSMREDNTKNMSKTTKNLQNIQDKIDILISRTNTQQKSSPASSNSSPQSSNKSSPITLGSKNFVNEPKQGGSRNSEST